jgi:hypothetical protein
MQPLVKIIAAAVLGLGLGGAGTVGADLVAKPGDAAMITAEGGMGPDVIGR